MVGTNSSYTASPSRTPQRSPARRPSQDGSQYEMDLDVLGLNSTFETSDLEDMHKPKVDTVETSDIEGPEDFTMNMTYWMTADLTSSQQIRSRKEAKAHISEVRGDVIHEVDEVDEVQDTTAEGDRAIIEESTRDPAAAVTSTTPTRRNSDANNWPSKKALSDVSMENDEKVRSYLSALPDTEIPEDALTGTPLRVPKVNLLQVPSPVASRQRSLQATVEDFDTPRKPTQETVIHHAPGRVHHVAHDSLQGRLAELQSRFERQETSSKSRIGELESLLKYTKADLEVERKEVQKQREQARNLQSERERQRKETEQRLKARENELNAKMQEFGEELQLQNLSKLQSQRDDFEQQIQALEEAKRASDESGKERDLLLRHMQTELSNMRESVNGSHLVEPDFSQQHLEVQTRINSLRTRANSFQVDLDRATSEATSARKEAQEYAKLQASTEATNEAQRIRILDLEARLESLQKQPNSAPERAGSQSKKTDDVSDLEERIQCLQARLEDSRAEVAAKDKQLQQPANLDSQLQSLQKQLEAARADAAAKDQQLLQRIEEQEQSEQRINTAQGRVQSLESTVTTLRQQLAEAHRDSAKARADAEQFEENLEEANDRLQDARAEADRRVVDIERKLGKLKESRLEAESRFRELQSEHGELVEDQESKLEDVREKAEDAVRKAGALLEQERSEKKRLAKELKKTSREMEQLRQEATAKKAGEEDFSDDESSLISSSTHPDTKEAEIENLRTLLRTQTATLKTLKTESSALRKENSRLKTSVHKSSSSTDILSTLHSELASLRRENAKLVAAAKAREVDFDAMNKAMDERLATVLSKVMRERARTVVGKRDGQWADSVGKMNGERELLGRVLMREWGKQEVVVKRETEEQPYRYKFVQRP
ncbi:hypothetical protein P280DRAFT_465038 [Massarina eburnea CBS 473.64]|uniref:Uncharacterized protein n=1 Tax=Massarina eburnea CBS 473.64 TaxID=1395130 RepID=A0A6A6SIQ6_9PLEO|nr:hypothetical protein P280DRAFT_465038 [Massarina eburnea CBS 473.64]